MTRAARVLALALLAAGLARTAAAAPVDWLHAPGAALERLDRALVLATRDGRYRLDLSGLVDVEAYGIDERPPGLIFGDDSAFVNPRLSLFLDARAGRQLYSFVQLRVDRGFDPRARSSDARFDEYLLRWTPLGDDRLAVQVGKFATVVGNWVPRHLSWNNPFVTAPLPYDNVTIVSDDAAPPSVGAFLARRDLADRKAIWLPVVWGPSYTSGFAVLAHRGMVDVAVEVKNAALSSRPAVWDGRNRGWTYPTVSGRVGVRPSPAWRVGVSGSHGAYLRTEARSSLPPGASLADFAQDLVGLDVGWAWRHLQVWAELFASRFDVPRVGDADTLAWYVESRYKATPALWTGLRFAQQVFGDVRDAAGRDVFWDRDAWRLDGVVGWRFDRHVQVKLQYGYGRQRGNVQQGEHLLAAQATLRF